jgi:hypothetical protein
MSLSQEAIEEYKQIYKKKLGEEISDEDAREAGQSLIDLFRVIYRPLHGVDYEKEVKEKDC